MSRAPSSWLLTTAVALAFTACDNPQATHEHAHDVSFSRVGAGQVGAMGKQVRQATSRFNSVTQVAQAGYVEASPCVSAGPLGGMGHHYVNFDLVDPVFDPLNPEAILYEPQKNGQLRLVAVEYIVINTGSNPAPTFDGHPFDVGGVPDLPVPHWSLHVWLHRPNPNGLYTPFNPDVVCP
jgi:hypothetical protein